MKNWIKSYWSNCLSITAIICSLVAICVSLPSAPELGIDYIGVIVGILSLLVTMLIGWQIYNVIAIDKKIEDKVEQTSSYLMKSIDSTKKEMLEHVREENERSLNQILIALSIMLGDEKFEKKQYADALSCYLEAVSNSIELIPFVEDINLGIEIGIERTIKTIKLVDKEKVKEIIEKDINHFIKSLLKLEDDKAIDIIIFLRGL